jgi:flavin reductase (DIM6/NTAB) family NADH-FMN oxidoreductase RutF
MEEKILAWERMDIDKMDKAFRRNLINCLSGFKSANLLGTRSLTGKSNLAIFSQVFHVGANPPLMGVLFRPNVVPRHSLENIRNTGHFTLNQIHKGIYDEAHQTSARYERDESEFEAVGLTPEDYHGFPAPFVEEAKLKIGLVVKEMHTIQANQTVLIVGEIVSLRVPEQAVSEDGFIDLESLNTVTISGLDSYHSTSLIKRLPYAKKQDI